MQLDMTRALAARPSEDEVKAAMKRVSRRRLRRVMMIVLACAVGLFLLWALLFWLNNATLYVDNDDYSIDLYTTDKGYVFMEYHSLNGRWQTPNMRFDEQTRTVHIIGETVRLPLRPASDTQTATTSLLFWHDDETGFMWQAGRSSYPVAEIRRGRGDQPEEILWQSGDPKPPAAGNALTSFSTPTPMPFATVPPTEQLPALTDAPEAFVNLAPRLTPSPAV